LQVLCTTIYVCAQEKEFSEKKHSWNIASCLLYLCTHLFAGKGSQHFCKKCCKLCSWDLIWEIQSFFLAFVTCKDDDEEFMMPGYYRFFSSPCCNWRNRFGEETTEVWIWCRSSLRV
jgi:hypothetical protein